VGALLECISALVHHLWEPNLLVILERRFINCFNFDIAVLAVLRLLSSRILLDATGRIVLKILKNLKKVVLRRLNFDVQVLVLFKGSVVLLQRANETLKLFSARHDD
jgi:hypothetical protein